MLDDQNSFTVPPMRSIRVKYVGPYSLQFDTVRTWYHLETCPWALAYCSRLLLHACNLGTCSKCILPSTHLVHGTVRTACGNSNSTARADRGDGRRCSRRQHEDAVCNRCDGTLCTARWGTCSYIFIGIRVRILLSCCAKLGRRPSHVHPRNETLAAAGAERY